MSEKGKELKLELEEEEEEEVILDHWSHKHPLSLVEIGRGYDCFGCGRRLSSGERGYGCRNKSCAESIIWHEECAKMPKKIRHPMHPHTLFQQHIYSGFFWRGYESCAICGRNATNIAYLCTSSKCEFVMGLECAQVSGVIDATNDDDDERCRRIIWHPSHPDHELRLLRKCAFRCNACGSTHKGLGDSFLCTVCEYWIHHSCASLPTTLKREDHHHQLSLSFRVPIEYMKYDFKCEVCHKYLILKYWIYHCQLCRYVVHVKCAFNNSPQTTIRNNANEKGIIQFPIDDVGEELIRAFVIREGGAIPPIPCDDEIIVNAKYKFHNHNHELSLISLRSSYGGGKEEEEEEEDSDDDECGRISQLICDGCTSPIFEKKHGSSSSSSRYYYMRCNECRYCLHLACFHLPPCLPALPLLHHADHELVLQPCAKLEFSSDQYCSVCELSSNGLFYECTRCEFKVDIKCASLPNTIYHTAHPQHHLNFHHPQNRERTRLVCAAGCGHADFWYHYYGCDNCEFNLHVSCAVLPASMRNRKWDKKHRLLLRWDASVDHPDAFYCDACESEMDPKMQMYHCRPCDLSFHPDCFPAISGYSRNIKFGQQYAIADAHHHPLTFQITTKLRCNVCRLNCYHERGFYCASCNFFICLHVCCYTRLQNGGVHALD